MEIIFQICFAYHGIKIRWQVCQNIVIDLCGGSAEQAWNQQCHCNYQNQFAELYHKVRNLLHRPSLHDEMTIGHSSTHSIIVNNLNGSIENNDD